MIENRQCHGGGFGCAVSLFFAIFFISWTSGVNYYTLASVCCVVFKPLYFAFVLYRARLIFYPYFNASLQMTMNSVMYYLPLIGHQFEFECALSKVSGSQD